MGELLVSGRVNFGGVLPSFSVSFCDISSKTGDHSLESLGFPDLPL